MKISKIFHSLYFMVMFLPLFIIPIFAININQKNVEPLTVTVGGDYIVQNKYETNNVETINDIQLNKVYTYEEFELAYDEAKNYTLQLLEVQDTNINDFYSGFDEFYLDGSSFKDYYVFLEFRDDDTSILYISFDEDYANYVSFTWNKEYYLNGQSIKFLIVDGLNAWKTTDIQNAINNGRFYSSKFEQLEYVYVDEIVYDNTDIGSQFLYSIYKPVHDYFNFGQYFGLNGVYDWFQANFFNGTAPLPFFIFWNLLVYWLIISLLWLIFDVLIYVPMYIHRWLDKGALE